MARTSFLSDEMIRRLVAVGEVDILVGVPTFNNAETIEAVVKTLHVGLARQFPRERTVILNPDGRSDDGTPDLVRRAPMAAEELRGSSSLRTTHRVSAPHLGVPGRASGVRTVFAAADLLQARAVILIDAEVTSMTPEWVAELARPVWKEEAELVLPIHPRHAAEGPLIGQMVRPLLGTAYHRRLRSDLVGGFAVSGRLAGRLLARGLWEDDPGRAAIEMRIVAASLADDVVLRQVHLGARLTSASGARATLPELFEQVVGSAFDALSRDAATWTARTEPVEVPIHGEPHPPGPGPDIEAAPLAERFRNGVRDLEPLLREILSPATLTRTQAVLAEEGTPHVPDGLWVDTLFEFTASAHRAVMNRDHLTQALIPLYLGRAASFITEIGCLNESDHASRLAALEQEFEARRPSLLELWNLQGRR